MTRYFLMALVLALAPCSAAPSLTTVQDILFKADGTRFTGTAVIEWKSFQAQEGSNIAAQNITLKIVNGVLRVQLVPTVDAQTRAYYLVRYNSDGKIQFNEYWTVPPSRTPLKLRDVRTSGLIIGGSTTAGAGTVQITDVTGLSDELAIRPVKGAGYTAGRAAVVNADGELDAAAGDPSDCVRVDGSTGPCGTGGGANPGFVDMETPAGIVDGSNVLFTLVRPASPPSSLLLYRNGILQKQGLDYTLVGASISFAGGAIPQQGDVLLASYRLIDTGNPSVFGQVLCSSNGSGTNSTSQTRLGGCTIGAGVLQPGDRVAIQFGYSHEGAASGFSVELRWNGTAVVIRTVAAGEVAIEGRAEVGLYAGGGQWGAQSWGTSTTFASGAGSAAGDPGTTAVPVDLFGQLAGVATDTVTLRNFTVIRYPGQPGS